MATKRVTKKEMVDSVKSVPATEFCAVGRCRYGGPPYDETTCLMCASEIKAAIIRLIRGAK
jgi:hypothetical protein